jgi:hypothetical protein
MTEATLWVFPILVAAADEAGSAVIAGKVIIPRRTIYNGAVAGQHNRQRSRNCSDRLILAIRHFRG